MSAADTNRSLCRSQNESRSLSCWAISAIIWRTMFSLPLSLRWRCCRWRASSMSNALYGITSGGWTLTFARRSLPRCAADSKESFRHWYSPVKVIFFTRDIIQDTEVTAQVFYLITGYLVLVLNILPLHWIIPMKCLLREVLYKL